MEKEKKRQIILIILLVIIAAYGTYQLFSNQKPQSQQVTQAPAKSTQQIDIKKPEQIEVTLKIPSYDVLSLRDPFYPQILRREIVKGASPLENYELEELKLTGIIRDNKTYRALIKTPDGRHFVVKEKDKIGIHGGIIMKIWSDKIEVRESIKYQVGKATEVTKTLKLRTEEGL